MLPNLPIEEIFPLMMYFPGWTLAEVQDAAPAAPLSPAQTGSGAAEPMSPPVQSGAAIEARIDPTTGHTYYFDPATGASAWKREELLPASQSIDTPEVVHLYWSYEGAV